MTENTSCCNHGSIQISTLSSSKIFLATKVSLCLSVTKAALGILSLKAKYTLENVISSFAIATNRLKLRKKTKNKKCRCKVTNVYFWEIESSNKNFKIRIQDPSIISVFCLSSLSLSLSFLWTREIFGIESTSLFSSVFFVSPTKLGLLKATLSRNLQNKTFCAKYWIVLHKLHRHVLKKSKKKSVVRYWRTDYNVKNSRKMWWGMKHWTWTRTWTLSQMMWFLNSST